MRFSQLSSWVSSSHHQWELPQEFSRIPQHIAHKFMHQGEAHLCVILRFQFIHLTHFYWYVSILCIKHKYVTKVVIPLDVESQEAKNPEKEEQAPQTPPQDTSQNRAEVDAGEDTSTNTTPKEPEERSDVRRSKRARKDNAKDDTQNVDYKVSTQNMRNVCAFGLIIIMPQYIIYNLHSIIWEFSLLSKMNINIGLHLVEGFNLLWHTSWSIHRNTETIDCFKIPYHDMLPRFMLLIHTLSSYFILIAIGQEVDLRALPGLSAHHFWRLRRCRVCAQGGDGGRGLLILCCLGCMHIDMPKVSMMFVVYISGLRCPWCLLCI